MPSRRLAVSDRFWGKVNKDGPTPEHRPDLGPCWIWTAGKNNRGYGWFWDGLKKGLAHRFGYKVQVGEIPEGLDVLHHCDNPPCIRGSHLFTGDAALNSADMVMKGRVGSMTHPESIPRGELNGSSKLKTAEVIEIRARLRIGETNRELSLRFGVCEAAINHIATGRNWKHLLEPGEEVAKRERKTKMDESMVAESRLQISLGAATIASLARRYSVSETAIRDAVKGRTWKHLSFPANTDAF